MIKKIATLSFLCLALSSCATKLSTDHSTLEPSKVKFSKFKKVEIKPVSLTPEFANNANKRAQKKINELLQPGMKAVLNNVTLLEQGAEFSKSKEPVLQITPHIKEIKFVSIAKRFWFGWFAGSSAVLMQVNFVDSSNGQIIAQPEFYAVGNAFSGSLSIGRSDNAMLNSVSQDVVNYTSNNK